MKSKATNCGSISTTFSSIVLLCVSAIIMIMMMMMIIIIITIMIIMIIIMIIEIIKHWVDVQRDIVSSHGERDPL